MTSSNLSHIAYRGLRYFLSLFLIVTLIFLIPRLMPGDPFLNILGHEVYYGNPELVDELKAQYGLDKPLSDQYIDYMACLAHGDLGYSFHFHQPVLEIIAFRLKWTLVLLIPAIIIAAILGVVTGSITGWRRGSREDSIVTMLSLFFNSMPAYWLAMLSTLVFAMNLGIFPLSGITQGGLQGTEKYVDIMWHMVLPVSILTLFMATYNYLIMRSSVIQTSGEGFILTARVKGLRETDILFHHVLKNALLPVITVIAMDFGFMVAGTLLVEIVFSWGGMGTLIYDGVLNNDYPLLHGAFLIIAICVLSANFIADVLYTVLDPRISRGGPT